MTYPITSHLYEPSPPIRTRLLTNLSIQSSLLQALFTLLASPSPTTAVLPPLSSAAAAFIHISPSGNGTNDTPAVQLLYTALAQVDAQLAEIVGETYTHQAAWEELEKRKNACVEMEQRVRQLVGELESGREVLEEEVREGAKVRESIERSETAPLSASTLLATAHHLGKTTSAPVSSLLPPQERAYHTPWPSEATMRMGLLFRLGGSMSGVGDIGKVGDEQDANKRPIEPTLPTAAAIAAAEAEAAAHHAEERRVYNPNAVFGLDLDSDSDDE